MEFLTWLPIIIVIVFMLKQIILPEISSIKRVMNTLDYIESHKYEYMRVGDALFQLNKDTIDISFDDKMMSINDGRVFVSYKKNTFGTTKINVLVERAKLILNQYENGKSITR